MTYNRWTTAIMLNAFVFPGAGHWLIGRRLSGVIIGVLAVIFLMTPLAAYTRTTLHLFSLLKYKGTGLSMMGQAWTMNQDLILWCLAGLVITWGFGILDLVVRRRRREQ